MTPALRAKLLAWAERLAALPYLTAIDGVARRVAREMRAAAEAPCEPAPIPEPVPGCEKCGGRGYYSVDTSIGSLGPRTWTRQPCECLRAMDYEARPIPKEEK
jgi:hypothetical protein